MQSSERSKRQKYNMWGKEDEEAFLRLFEKFGKEFKKYEEFFPNRSYNQIRCFYRNYVMRQQRQFFEEERPKATGSNVKLEVLNFIVMEDLDLEL